MKFLFKGLHPGDFSIYFELSDEALQGRGLRRLTAEEGFPCRISLRDAPPGAELLLLNHEHVKAPSPYRGSGPIFVTRYSTQAELNEVPPDFRSRLYSARAYDGDWMMVDADVVEGLELERGLERLFADPAVDRVHLHHARRGCFACEVTRV